MKFRNLLCAAAGAALLMGGVALQPANAAGAIRPWCTKTSLMGNTGCYRTLTQCKKFATGNQATCIRNPKLTKRRMRSTTGMK